MSRWKASGQANGIRLPFATPSSAISTKTASGRTAIDRDTAMVAIAEKLHGRRSRFKFLLDRPGVLGSLFLAPAILYVLVLVGVPFLLAVYYALSAYTIYNPTYHFVGLRNFIDVVQSDIFRRTLVNTFIFTIGSHALGLILGKFGALLLLRPFPGRRIVRALIILPWAVPIALATVAWEWMFDSLYR